MTYEYACNACGHAWEAEQSISAPPLSDCPQCHQATAKRQVSGGAGFILKGGGWYADGYGSKKSVESAPSEGKPSDGKPSDSKPSGAGAAKPDAAAANSSTPAAAAPAASSGPAPSTGAASS